MREIVGLIVVLVCSLGSSHVQIVYASRNRNIIIRRHTNNSHTRFIGKEVVNGTRPPFVQRNITKVIPNVQSFWKGCPQGELTVGVQGS